MKHTTAARLAQLEKRQPPTRYELLTAREDGTYRDANGRIYSAADAQRLARANAATLLAFHVVHAKEA